MNQNAKCAVPKCNIFICYKCHGHIFRWPSATIKQAHADLIHKAKITACACTKKEERRGRAKGWE